MMRLLQGDERSLTYVFHTLLLSLLLCSQAPAFAKERTNLHSGSKKPPLEGAHEDTNEQSPGRTRVRIFVAVFTGFASKRYEEGVITDRYEEYAVRRKAVRETWLTAEALSRYENELDVLVRFVVGNTDDPVLQDRMAKEEEQHGDMLRLDFMESYQKLSHKTKLVFKTIAERYEADWIVKVDDDMLLLPDRLIHASKEWEEAGADFVGEMSRGKYIFHSSIHRETWPELLGQTYHLHPHGHMYALKGKVVEDVIVRNYDTLRLFSNEDIGMGAWMLAHNVNFYDEKRVSCEECTESCINLISGPFNMKRDYENPLCHAQYRKS